MNVHFISKSGEHKEVYLSLSLPTTLGTLSSLLAANTDVGDDFSVVVNEKVIIDPEFVIQQHHELWCIKQATFDIKSWRAAKAEETS